VDALSGDREALWARVASADFLTVNEKRAAVGYGAIDGGDAIGGTAALSAKYGFDPNQPRVPAGSTDGGQWTGSGGGGDGGAGSGSSARVSAAGAGGGSAEPSTTRLAGDVVRICVSIGAHVTRDSYGNLLQSKSSYLCANGEVVTRISTTNILDPFIRDPFPY
jgi:hypothetical protein